MTGEAASRELRAPFTYPSRIVLCIVNAKHLRTHIKIAVTVMRVFCGDCTGPGMMIPDLFSVQQDRRVMFLFFISLFQ